MCLLVRKLKLCLDADHYPIWADKINIYASSHHQSHTLNYLSYVVNPVLIIHDIYI